MSSHNAAGNQANACVRMLVDELGFEDRGPLNALVKVIDDQHGLAANVLAKEESRARDLPDAFRVEFGVSRRDVNEHLVLWEAPAASVYVDGWWVYSTVSEHIKDGWFDKSVVELSYREPFASVRSRVAAAVERLPSLANLEFVEAELYRERRGDNYAYKRAVNDALNGDFRGQAFFERRRAQTEAGRDGPMKDKAIAKLERFEANIAAFRERFPNGVPRP